MLKYTLREYRLIFLFNPNFRGDEKNFSLVTFVRFVINLS